MIGIIFGLIGAVLIGGSDCVARVTAQRVSVSVLFLFVMGLSFVALTGWMLYANAWPALDLWGWSASAASGFLNLVALYFLYTALARGPVTVASPAASSFSVMLVGINVMAGQPYTLWQLLAALIVFFGIVMLAQRSETATEDQGYDRAWLRLTALLGLGAGGSIALRMFLAQEAGTALGPIEALYLNRLFALIGAIALIAWEVQRQRPQHWPAMGPILGLVLLQSLLEMLAMGAFLLGSQDEGRINAAIGFSAFSAVTAIVAWLWLKEPIGWRRSLWMLVVSGGVVMAVVTGP